MAQVDSAYEHLASYQLDVRSTTKFMRNGSAMSNMVPNMEGVTMIASSPPSKSRFETRGAGGKGLIQVTDGLSTVQYDENSNSYQQRALIPLGLPGSNLASADPDGVVAVSGQTWAVSSFGMVKNPRILREESLQAENRAIPCYVIEAETDVAKGMAAAGLAPKATYWIDKIRHLILRFEQKSVMTVNGDTYETDQFLDFSYTSVNEPLPDALFKFTPPKGATVRRELELPTYSSPIGSVAPQFALQLPDKSIVESAQLKGKVVILAFWTTWCTPCWAQLETLERIQKEFAGKDLVIFGINEEAEGLAQQFLGQRSLTLLSLSDPTASLRTAYSVSGVPSTVVIDKNGRTSGRHLGLLAAEDMRKLLEKVGIK